MTCHECTTQLDVYLDDELDSISIATVSAHLQGCNACRKLCEALRTERSEWKKLLLTTGLSQERLITRIHDQILISEPVRAKAHSPRWLPVFARYLTVLLAGFVLAWWLRPWWDDRPVESANRSLLQNAAPKILITSGEVKALPGNAKDWIPQSAGMLLQPGSRIRTGERAKCEIHANHGAVIRLNGESELEFLATGQWKLIRGQVYTLVQDEQKNFELLTPDGKVLASASEFDFTFNTDQQRLLVLLGSATLIHSGTNHAMQAGQGILLRDGKVSQQMDSLDTVAATHWIHDILVQKGKDNPELSRRVNQWLAHLGRDKIAFLHETEIRALGEHGVIPLIKFLLSDESKRALEVQIDTASSIIADLAQPGSLPDLISLLKHASPTVRIHAAQALYRLTRQTLGLNPAQWGNTNEVERTKAIERWQAWYMEYQSRN